MITQCYKPGTIKKFLRSTNSKLMVVHQHDVRKNLHEGNIGMLINTMK